MALGENNDWLAINRQGCKKHIGIFIIPGSLSAIHTIYVVSKRRMDSGNKFLVIVAVWQLQKLET